nr:MAG TPA: hypothetical protein [Caudoviricetes sp.]
MPKQTPLRHFKRCFKLFIKLGSYSAVVYNLCLDLPQRLSLPLNLYVLFSCAAVSVLYPLFPFTQGVLLVATQFQHLIAKSHACWSCHS